MRNPSPIANTAAPIFPSADSRHPIRMDTRSMSRESNPIWFIRLPFTRMKSMEPHQATIDERYSAISFGSFDNGASRRRTRTSSSLEKSTEASP